MNEALTIGFTPPRDDAAEDLVLLEQKAWSLRTGLLTRAGMVRWLGATLYDRGDADNLVACGLNGNGDIELAVYVYPLRPGVRFRLVFTAGQAEGGEYEEIEEEESVSFDMTATATLSHPALRVAAARWLVGPFDPDGAPVEAPPLWTDGRQVLVSRPVYGSAHLTLVTPRWAHRLVLPWADAAALLEAGWSEFAVCLPPPGRPVALALEAPPDAEDLLASDGQCGGRRYRVKPAGEAWPPSASPANKYINCDYCALECEEPTYGP